MALTVKEISARHYRNRKDNGLCPRCGKVLDRQGHFCSVCLEKANQYTREARAFARSMGFCPECKKEKLVGEEKICLKCSARRYANKKPITEEQRIRYNKNFREKQNELYKQRREQGICGECGKRKAEEGKSRCRICLDKNAEIHRRKRQEKGSVKEYRKENGLCFYCGEKADTKSQVCQKCYDRCVENGKKSTAHLTSYWRLDNKLIFLRKKDKQQ